jgi:deoxyribonuclease V
VKVKKFHSWQLGVPQAQDLQRQLAGQVLKQGEVTNPQFIAGVDISTERGQSMATAAVVVLNYPELKLVETRIIEDKLGFPYIPGLLSFRESPLILTACEQLAITPDLILVDGQGLAHPRRFGIASHLGLLLDLPTIGCAKSRLCGTHRTPEAETGSYADIIDKGEVIGVALRTRPGTTPVYVSIGHKVDLAMAIRWVLNCCRGYRIPEPLRLAHLAAGGNLKPEKNAIVSDSGYQKKLFD